jgi:hypothetical protein
MRERYEDDDRDPAGSHPSHTPIPLTIYAAALQASSSRAMVRSISQ